MNTKEESISSLAIGFYAWVATAFFGGILADILYSNALSPTLSASESIVVFSTIADVLLLLSLAVMLSSIAAIAFSWKSAAARNILVVSLLLVSLEFLIPALISPFLQGAQIAGFGSLLRLVLSSFASILASFALYSHYRDNNS